MTDIRTPLEKAILINDIEYVENLSSPVQVTYKNIGDVVSLDMDVALSKIGTTAPWQHLLVAVTNNNFQRAAYWLEHGADPNVYPSPDNEDIEDTEDEQYIVLQQHISAGGVDEEGWLPIALAAERGNMDMFKLLESYGADIHAYAIDEERSCSTLEHALISGNLNLVRYVCSRGVNRYRMKDSSRSPFEDLFDKLPIATRSYTERLNVHQDEVDWKLIPEKGEFNNDEAMMLISLKKQCMDDADKMIDFIELVLVFGNVNYYYLVDDLLANIMPESDARFSIKIGNSITYHRLSATMLQVHDDSTLRFHATNILEKIGEVLK